MHIAAYMNETAAVQAMLEKGAIPRLANGLNFTAIDLATQEDLQRILRTDQYSRSSGTTLANHTLDSVSNLEMSLIHSSSTSTSISADAPTNATTQDPTIRSILRVVSTSEAGLKISLIRNETQKKKVTFNEAAEIRQFIDLSSDEEEEAPRIRRRNVFMMSNYDENDGSEEEEEETEQIIEEEDDEQSEMVDDSDELDILARLQDEMNTLGDYEDSENYDWEQFESENDEDEHAIMVRNELVTGLNSSNKRMDLEDDIPDATNVNFDDQSVIYALQAATSITTDSLLKELITSPDMACERSSIVKEEEDAYEQVINRTEDVTEEREGSIVFQINQAVIDTKADEVEETQEAIQLILPEEVLSEDVLSEQILYEQVLCEKALPEVAASKEALLENALSDPILPDSGLPELVLLEKDELEAALPEQALSKEDFPEQEALPEQSLTINDTPVDSESDTGDNEPTTPKLEATKLPSTESLPSEQSFISSASEDSTNQRSQIKGSQRMRWESDIMSPVDTESPMSFASIFAANQNKIMEDSNVENHPKSYINLLLPNDEFQGQLLQSERISVIVADIALKPLPAVPYGENTAAKRITGIFQKLSDKRRIAPAMNGLKQISIPNLKLISLEQALRRAAAVHKEVVSDQKSDQPEAGNVQRLPPVNQPKRSKSMQAASAFSKYFAKNRTSSGDGSDNSDSINLFDNDSQSSGSQYDTPPSSPSPSGSFEEQEKRLSSPTKKNSVKRRQSMPSFTSRNMSVKSAKRYQEPSSTSNESISTTHKAKVNATGSLTKRHSLSCNMNIPSKKYVLDVVDRSHATAFANTMQESIERISDGQKPKRYTERYQQDFIHLSQPTSSFSPRRAGSVSPSWKAAQDPNKGGTFTKSKQRSAANSTRSRNKDIPGKLYVRLVAVQDVNVPIPDQPTYVRCILNDGTYEHLSKYVMLGRQMQFDQEFKITANSRLDFSLSLHVRADNHVKPKAPIARLLTSHKKMTPELSSFVNRQDGAIGSTRISFGDMIDECRSKLCSATFPCQNDWVVDLSKTIDNTTKQTPKVIGKLVLHLVYIPGTKERHIVSTMG
jgi:hypothetical protein